MPEEVVTNNHQADLSAIREEVPGAVPIVSGLPRAGGPTITPGGAFPVPGKDRARSMRGVQRIETGQRVFEAVERADPHARGTVPQTAGGTHARAVAATVTWMATTLEHAAEGM